MNQNITRLNTMLDKSQQNHEEIKTKFQQSLTNKESEIAELKIIIDEQKCKMQDSDSINRNKLAVLERDVGNLRTSLTDKDRDICELRNNLENDNKMLQ